MAKMQFEADAEGIPSKSAVGMYSKEEEYVPFSQPCDCTGQVELHSQVFYLQNSLGTCAG